MNAFKFALNCLMTCGLLVASPGFAQSAAECSTLAPAEQDACLSGTQKNRQELAAIYPDIDAGSTKPENKKILCPFLRTLERAGIFDPEKETQSSLTVGIIKIATVAREFGCSMVSCGGVATAVSSGQLAMFSTSVGRVNVEKLHKALGIAHDCGLGFAKGGTVVDDATRAKTLSRLQARADDQGHLQFSDIQAVKLQTCSDRGVKISTAGSVEVGLIYTFLGGNERGFVDYDDVVRLFHAELPQTIGNPGLPNVK